jgi:hypothetical protein
MLEALRSSAERGKTTPEKLLEQLRSSGRIARLKEELASRRAVELMVEQAKPISVEQAKARNLIWTPGNEEKPAGQLWTPGS